MTNTAQDGVHGITLCTFQVAALEKAVVLHVSDHCLQYAAPSQAFLRTLG